MEPSTFPQWVRINRIVEAYEAARERGERTDLACFLPDRRDVCYLDALIELVRVDMEYCWREKPIAVADYVKRFPELERQAELLDELRHEQARLRPEHDCAGHPPPGAFPEAGSDFLDFRLLIELGRGPFSRVFVARQPGLGNRLVVLKFSTIKLGEPQTLARLQHSHIVPIQSVFQQGPLEVICMPYVGATTLQHVVEALETSPHRPESSLKILEIIQKRSATTWAGCPEERPMSRLEAFFSCGLARNAQHSSYTAAVLRIGACLADGLSHAHQQDVLHLDLKPANILLTDSGLPVVLDFNLAFSRRRRNGTQQASVGGTIPYMAPEHLEAFIRRTKIIDRRADIYSLGVMLFQLLTGRLPFPAIGPVGESELQVTLQERWKTVPSLRSFNEQVSADVDSLVRKCLTPRPAGRFPNAGSLRESLDRLVYES